ncbi:hypothetical protein ACFT7S_35240 [Streptomyces sp. NPDC057136]|uniref:hypothetical protein n=1 Tax=Streptomyces sp. NPDC057136 TaxID=3346029 RepID=UPI003637557E
MHWAARADFDRRAGALMAWGVGLLLVATGLLAWLGYLLLAPFTMASYQHDVECEAPISATYAPDEGSFCGSERDWPELLGILSLSVPPAVTGAALLVSGSTRRRTSTHVLQVLEMQASEERARNKA